MGPTASSDADATVLRVKLSLNWTGPFKILEVGPAASAPDKRPLADKVLYLNLPSDMPGASAKPRVTVERCKPCTGHTMPTARCFHKLDYALCPQQTLQQVTSLPRSRQQRPHRSPTPRGRKNHWTPIGPCTRRRHRCPLRDTMERPTSHFLGTGNGPQPLQTTHPSILIRCAQPTPINRPPVPTNAHRSRQTGIGPRKGQPSTSPGYDLKRTHTSATSFRGKLNIR